jgi:hypothetical protein
MATELNQSLPATVDITLQAATDAALASLLITHGLLIPGEAGVLPAPGVLHSHIGAGVLDGVALDGRYAFIGIDTLVFGAEATASLLLAVAPHRYLGPDLRARLGGSGFDDASVVPQAVTMRQARLALLGAGKLSEVTAAINALPEPAKSAALITWEYSQEVQRHNGLVPQMATALGMTDEQIDALFVAAAAL